MHTFDMLDFVDISELNLPKSCSISFPNGKDDLMTFEISIKPDEGYYTWVIFISETLTYYYDDL